MGIYIYILENFIYFSPNPPYMKRRIIKLGSSTLVVSLPAKWTKKYNIEAGHEINLEEEESRITITTEERKKKTSTVINLSKLTESSIRTIITNSYRLGFDTIKVNYKDKKYLKIINQTVKNLIGFDIITQKEDHCIIENITEPSVEHLDKLIDKLIFNISEILLLTKERLGKKTTILEYKEIELKIKQYDDFCKRIVSKKNLENNQLIWVFLTTLVHAQREIYLLNKHLDIKKNISNAPEELFIECIEIFEMLKKAYFKKNIQILEELHEKEKQAIYKKAYNEFSKKKDNIITYHIAASIRNFYLAASPLMGLILTYEKQGLPSPHKL